MFDAKMISEAIRMKKKKMMNAEPELVDTDSRPDIDPNDMYDIDQKARIEETLDTPKKINADETMMNESYHGVGVSPEQKTRMGRLRMYMNKLDI